MHRVLPTLPTPTVAVTATVTVVTAVVTAVVTVTAALSRRDLTNAVVVKQLGAIVLQHKL